MPRKTSQAAAKDTSVAEGSAPRRSGRAATKQEPVGKDSNRSRRSSTAAQTAASVADSKSPKGRTSSSRRDSTSPSDGRSRTSRENVESPATRVKSTRRNASRINYKESDGEEEAAAPKFEDNFVSGEEFDDSESDEKSKRGRGKSKPAPKARSSKDKKKPTGRSRRGRTKKEAEEEEGEEEEVEAPEDEADPEETPTKRGRAAKARDPPKSSRSRGQKADTAEDKTSESKPSRRSSRGASSKEEATPRKRPSRGVQAKHYTEEEEEDIAELSDSKAEDEEENSKKRKREDSPEEPSKRAKEDKEEPSEVADSKKTEGEKEGSKMEDEKEPEEKSAEEPMEVDETDSSKVSDSPSKSENKDTKIDDTLDSEMKEDSVKETSVELSKKKEIQTSTPVESNTVSNVSAPGLKSEQASKPDESCKSKDVPKDVKESANVAKTDDSKPISDVSTERPEGISKPASEVPEPMVVQSSADSKTVTATVPEKSEKVVPTKSEENSNSPRKSEPEKEKQNNAPEESKAAFGSSTTEGSVPTTQSKETSDASLNGEEKDAVSKPASLEIHSNATLNSEVPDKSIPKANGAHNDVQHTKSSPTKDQYYSLPGRKYVINSKLSESLKQSIKNQTFGFVSYNLGTLGPDAYIQKEKLLNEINTLDAHLICLQQVAKPFYSSVLEPSLDALGFKSVFSQPENSLKGMATFYKSSLFRLSGQSEISLKQLIEKDIEASPLDPADRAAVKNHIRKCGNVLFSHLSAVLGSHAITVANVQIPPTDLSIHALQVSCLAKEVIKMNGGSNKPLLIGGEFNIAENDASYQLLKDGYLSNEMIEDLQKRKDVVLPEKENASLVNLLWKSFQHPSSNLCSCYTSVLGHEFVIPELKTTSPDLIWFSSDSLCTVGVLDAESSKPGDHRFSLKADVAFNA